MSNDSQPEVHEICWETEVCFQSDPESVVRETSFAKSEAVTNEAEAQKSETKEGDSHHERSEAKGKG